MKLELLLSCIYLSVNERRDVVETNWQLAIRRGRFLPFSCKSNRVNTITGLCLFLTNIYLYCQVYEWI
jgi:hypothetical protein